VRQRVVYARELVAEGHSPSTLARVLQISRQAIYRVPCPRRSCDAVRRPAGVLGTDVEIGGVSPDLEP